MKKSELRQIIKEELENLLKEGIIPVQKIKSKSFLKQVIDYGHNNVYSAIMSKDYKSIRNWIVKYIWQELGQGANIAVLSVGKLTDDDLKQIRDLMVNLIQ